MEKVAIYGAGALAKQIVAYNKRYNMFDIVALIDDNTDTFEFDPRIPVFDYKQFENVYPAENQAIVIYEGGGKSLMLNRLRKV